MILHLRLFVSANVYKYSIFMLPNIYVFQNEIYLYIILFKL